MSKQDDLVIVSKSKIECLKLTVSQCAHSRECKKYNMAIDAVLSLLDQATPVSGEAVAEVRCRNNEVFGYIASRVLQDMLPLGTKLYTAPQPAIPEGYALVPIVPTMYMLRVMQEEDWEWRDVLASCNAITEHDYLNHDAMIAEAIKGE